MRITIRLIWFDWFPRIIHLHVFYSPYLLSLLLDDKHFHLLLDAIPPIPTVSSYDRLGVNAVQRGGGVVYHVRVLGRAHPLAPSDAEDLHAFWSHELSKIVSLIGGIRGKIGALELKVSLSK